MGIGISARWPGEVFTGPRLMRGYAACSARCHEARLGLTRCPRFASCFWVPWTCTETRRGSACEDSRNEGGNDHGLGLPMRRKTNTAWTGLGRVPHGIIRPRPRPGRGPAHPQRLARDRARTTTGCISIPKFPRRLASCNCQVSNQNYRVARRVYSLCL